jgi:hypothetical protein
MGVCASSLPMERIASKAIKIGTGIVLISEENKKKLPKQFL